MIWTVPWLLMACRPDPTTPTMPELGDTPAYPVAELGLALDLTPFVDAPIPDDPAVFDLVSADLEPDGDLDLVVNRHLDVPMELYINVDGTYVHGNPKGDDSSGIYDNPSVPDLYGDESELRAAADAAGPGIFLWHDLIRNDRWHVYVRPTLDTPMPEMRVTVNRPLVDVSGDVSVTLIDEFHAEVQPLDPQAVSHFEIDSQLIGTQLILELLTDDPSTVYVGTTRAPVEGGRISLWKPDPHGMAWHDVVGGPGKELFVTRGGLIGDLLPPHEAKVDRLFVHTDGDTLYAQDQPAIPPNYGRGRQLAWVDLDGDGADELFIANTKTPNSVLDDLDGGGAFDDRAPELGLDLHEGDAFVWLDVNGDGWLDLIHSDVTEIAVAVSQQGTGFEVQPGSAWGLQTPAAPEDAPDGIFNPFTFQVADHDRDGDLDLWLSDWGAQRGVAVLRNDGGQFTDVTAALGLAESGDFNTLILADLDHDGWVDALGLDGEAHVWRNTGGTFVPTEVALDLSATPLSPQAVSTDLDGDGFIDVVGVNGETHWVLRNTTEQVHRPLRVHLDAPMGTRVVAHTDDGTVLGQQWGAMQTSRYSQGLQPLRFGVPQGATITHLEVTTPGGVESQRFEVVGTEMDVSVR